MKDNPLEDYFTCLEKYTDKNVLVPPPLNFEDFTFLEAGCTSFAKKDYPLKQDFYARLLNAAARGRVYGKMNNKFLLLTELFASLIPPHEVQAIENTIIIKAQMSNISIKSH